MGIKRVVDTQFWTDDKVIEMFSPEDKLFMLYLMTNPHTTQLGIYALSKKVMAFETGYSSDTISVLLDRFETKYDLIRYSNETKEVAIKNYLRHSIIKGGKPVEDLLTKEISKVKDKALLQYVFDGISSFENLNATVSNILPLLNQNGNDNGNENDNVDDNDNDVSYHDSCHDSSADQLKCIGGELGRGVVYLSDNQFNSLLEKLGLDAFNRYVKRLADYIIDNGVHIKSHYETSLKWHNEDSKI
jgi:hypothetical protein